MRVTIDTSLLRRVVSALGRYRAESREAAVRELDRIGRDAVERIKTRYRTGGTTADRTAVRTGRLRASYTHAVSRDPLVLSIGVSARSKALVYAGVHEGMEPERESTTIVPRRARALTIPLPAAQTRAGVTRRSARAYEDTFVHDGVIYQRRGKTKIVPLFLLRKRVVIPARPALRRISDDVVAECRAAIGAAYGRA